MLDSKNLIIFMSQGKSQQREVAPKPLSSQPPRICHGNFYTQGSLKISIGNSLV